MNFFSRLYVQFIFLATLVILLLTYFLYYNYKNYAYALVNQSNEKLMSQLFENAMQVNSMVKTYTLSMFNNRDTNRLMNGGEEIATGTLGSIQALDASLGSTPFLQSAYVYNGTTDTYYTMGDHPSIRKGTLFDREIIELLSHPLSSTMSPIPRLIPVSEWESSRKLPAYTYIMPEYADKGMKLKGAVVVNIKADWIFSSLAAYSKKESSDGTQMMIIDSAGVVIGHTDDSMFLADLSGEPHIRTILSSLDKPSGYFTSYVADSPYIITYSAYDSPRWIMVSITPYSHITQLLGKVRSITLTIGATVFVLCLLAAFLLSKHLYTPIGQLRDRVTAMLGHRLARKEAGNEFDFISSSLTSIHDKLQSLETFKKENLQQLRQDYFKNVLHGELPPSLEYSELFGEEGVRFDPRRPIVVIVLKIDHYAEFCRRYSETDRSLLKYAVINIIEEMLKPVAPGNVFDMGGEHLACLCRAGLPAKRLDALIRNIQDASVQFPAISLSCSVSFPAATITDVPTRYQEALALMNYRVVYGHACVIKAEDMERRTFDHFSIDDAMIGELLQALKNGRQPDISRLFSQIMHSLYDYPYSTIRFTLSYISASIFNTLNTLEKNSSICFGTDFVSFDTTIKRMETLEEIEREYMSLFQTIVDRITQFRDEKTERIVNNVVKYIELNFRDKQLSLASIAGHFNMTPAYVGRLFRERTAMSVAEYITNERISEAKLLLPNSRLNIDEIIDRIGWENNKYFYTVFKKHTGVTPTEFRLISKVRTIAPSEN